MIRTKNTGYFSNIWFSYLLLFIFDVLDGTIKIVVIDFVVWISIVWLTCNNVYLSKIHQWQGWS